MTIPNRNLDISELRLIIEGCIANDRRYQKRLFDIYSPFVYGIIRRYTSNNAYSEDILNETFLKIFKSIKGYSYSGFFEAWIKRITVNTIVDTIRANKKHAHSCIDTYNNTVKPIDDLSYKELLLLINTLPKKQKMIFNLFVFEDLSHKQIGELMNMDEGTSRWFLNDARKRLREKICLKEV